jgi:integrase
MEMAEAPQIQKLMKTTCDAVRTTGARCAVWDSELKGFGLRVSAQGVKTFVVRYRVGGGRTGVERMHTIGRYGPLTAEKARGLAKLALADVAAGGDPQGGRAAARAEMTVSELCDLYLSDGCATKKPLTLYSDKGRIERHIKPLIGRKRVSHLDRADVENLLADIAAGKTATVEKTVKRGKAVVTGGQGVATRTVALLSSIMTFAVGHKLRADNPVTGVKKFKQRKSERFLSPAEIGRLGAALAAMEAEGAHPYGLAIIRLLALTGARREEIAGLKWSEVDFDRGALRLEDSKTGQKVLALSPGAAAILGNVTQVAGSPYVFPAGKVRAKGDKAGERTGGDLGSGSYQGVAKVWNAARKVAKLEDVRLHDLRHTFASFGAGGGFGLPVIGALLGHRNSATTARYAHLADDPLRKANDWIGGEIGAALDRRAAG